MRLEKEIAKYDALVAFSGGVDSSVVAALAKKNCERSLAVTVDSLLLPRTDLKLAKKIAREIGIKHKIIRGNFNKIKNNPWDRCYLCKEDMYVRLTKLAERKGMTVLDGTNYSEIKERRPGMSAVKKFGVISPLLRCKITEKKSRKIAKKLKLSNWNNPSTTCLATRIPYGTKITAKKLERIEKAENFLRGLGFSDIRVRDHGKTARIEVNEKNFPEILKNKKKIIKKLRTLGYLYITLDLEGYGTGSMDKVL